MTNRMFDDTHAQRTNQPRQIKITTYISRYENETLLTNDLLDAFPKCFCCPRIYLVCVGFHVVVLTCCGKLHIERGIDA